MSEVFMAKFTFQAGEEFALRLSKLGAASEEIAKRAIYAGAEIIADEIRRNLDALPTDTPRRLRPGEKFSGPTEREKEDLLSSFGVTPVKLDRDGFWNVKIGFSGYNRNVTRKYPKGVPNQLVARAVESGSSVRQKRPFVRRAVTGKKKEALAAMEKAADEAMRQITDNG
jgi:hypothetical protein